MDWIDANQLGRRNLSPDSFKLLLGRRYNRVKKSAHDGGKGKSRAASVPQIGGHLPPPIQPTISTPTPEPTKATPTPPKPKPKPTSTAATLAATHGVGEATVKRAVKAKKIRLTRKASPVNSTRCEKRGQVNLRDPKQILQLAQAEKEEQVTSSYLLSRQLVEKYPVKSNGYNLWRGRSLFFGYFVCGFVCRLRSFGLVEVCYRLTCPTVFYKIPTKDEIL